MTQVLMADLQHMYDQIQQVIPHASAEGSKHLEAMLGRLRKAKDTLQEYDPEYDEESTLRQIESVVNKSKEVLEKHGQVDHAEVRTLEVQFEMPEVKATSQVWNTGRHWQATHTGAVYLDLQDAQRALSGKVQSNDLNLWRHSLQQGSELQVDLRVKP